MPDSSSGQSDDSMKVIRKRKRFILTPTPTTENITILDKPLSQLSISQGDPKRTKTIITIAATDNQVNDEMNELSTSYVEQCKPRYLKVPDRNFKQMLSTAVVNGYNMVQCLNTNEKLHIVRHATEVTNNFYYKDLQRQLWQEYHDIGSKADNWESRTTKQYAHQHHTCRMYRPRKSYIEQRQKTIEHQLQQIGSELHEYLIRLQQNITQWQPSIDFEILSHAINECVKNGQKRLRNEFAYKKEMLTLDWNDQVSITKFYGLKPNEELIQLAKKMWQATSDELRVKEQQEILRELIHLKRLPTKTDKLVNQLVHDNQITLSNPFLDPDQRTSFVSRCSKTIIQCKFNLMLVQVDEFEIVIRRHQLLFITLKEKLTKLNKENPAIYTTLLVDAIEDRRKAMMQRFFRIRQYKLTTFFDEAPAVDNKN